MPNKKINVKTVLRVLALSLVALFLGLRIYSWNARSLTGNALPMPFGFGMATVLSGSMEPALSVDDVIFVAEADEYGVGDVVVFQSGNMVVAHRIIGINGDMVTTQGDANNTPDAEMPLSAIKGRVIGHVSGMGSIVRMLKTPVVTYGLLGGAIFLMERSFRREKQQKQDQLDQIKEEIRRLKEGVE